MKRKRRAEKRFLSFLLSATVATIWVLAFLLQWPPASRPKSVSLIQLTTGVPSEIVYDAMDSGLLQVALWGTYSERHQFAKGEPTRFGQMSLDADHYLKYQLGWSESRIHRVGHFYGFSELR